MIETVIKNGEYDFISATNRNFIVEFDTQMEKLGYTSGDKIFDGVCWGKYMLIYTKMNVKSKKSYARIYIREENIILRMYFSNIDKQREVIERTPKHIIDVFTGDKGNCKHCKVDAEYFCKFRKTYTINNKIYEKCNGETFYFYNPAIEKLQDYFNLFLAFYPRSKSKRSNNI